MKLTHGKLYKHNVSNTVFQLIKHYDGESWYLKNTSDYGVKKTLPVSEVEMEESLINYYEEVKLA
ncbi:hypothetical protein CEW46_23945 [Bacillus cereus]|nr:hypothetical protein CEW46_23945 [Bacillus cereus]